MPWLLLILAGLLEVAWAIGMKKSDGFTRLWPSVWTIAGMTASFILLAFAMKHLPAGTAYPVWTGIGALGTVVVGILLLGEPATLPRLLFLALLLASLIGLKLT